MTHQLTLIEGKCAKCHKKTYIIENNRLCMACAGKSAVERIKNERTQQQEVP